jgi:plasmid stabilization system protein ParE
MAKLIWTEPALADVREIVSYIRRDSPAYARKMGQRLWY